MVKIQKIETTTRHITRKVNLREAFGLKKGAKATFALAPDDKISCTMYLDRSELINVPEDEEFIDENVNGDIYDTWSSIDEK